MNNTLIIHGAIGGEIKQIKWLSFKPTKVVENGDNAEHSDKFDMDDETHKALRTDNKLDEKEALPVVNNEKLAVEKQKTLDMAFEWREYERHLTTLLK